MRHAWAVILFATIGCAPGTSSIFVTVDGTAQGVDHFHVTLQNGGATSQPVDLLLDGRPVSLPPPRSFSLVLGADRRGEITVTVEARDAAEQVLAVGTGTVDIQPSHKSSLNVTLGGGVTDGGADGGGEDLAGGDLGGVAAVPDAPTNVVASSGDASATVSWSAPNAHGSAITAYTVTSSPGNITSTVDGATLSTIVGGLTNGVTYTFTVTATNGVGTSSPSSPSNAVTPLGAATVPAAPTNIVATISQPLAATVSWAVPDNHGSPLTGYTITSSPGNVMKSAPANATSASVTGLTAGTTYVFTVTATNGIGAGPASSPSNSVTVADVPTAPGSVAAQANVPGGVTVSWTAASAVGSSISKYTVSWSGGQQIVNGTTTQAVIQPLTAGQTYTFSVTATDAVGTGPAGTASATVVDVPTVPTNVTANANVSKGATVSWTASNANGSAILYYTVTSSGGQSAKTSNGTTTSAVVAGLTAGSSYTFTVTATNGMGTSSPSASSNTVVAADVPAAPGNVLANANVPKGATVTWTAPSSNGSAITGYTVHWSPGAGVSPMQPATATQYVVNNLTPGTTYTFTVTATNAIGTGPASSGSNATILDIPAAPGGFAACALNLQVHMVWNSVASAASYNLYYSTVSGGELTGTKIANVTSPYTLTGLANGTTYYLEVTAANKVGESTPSTEQSATPTAQVHDMLFVGISNTNSVYVYDCYSLLGSSVSSPSRTLTLPASTNVAAEGGLAVDKSANALYVGTAKSGGEILIYHNAGTLSGSPAPDVTATGVFNDVNGNPSSPSESVDGIVLDTTRGILYADSFGYFTFFTNAAALTGRVPFHDSTFGTVLGHGSQMALDSSAANTLYLGQLSTVGGSGQWNVSVFPNLSSVAAPASGYATMPTPTKQITLAAPDTFNVNAGTLAIAIDTDPTRDLLYVSGSNSSSGSNVFTLGLSTANATTPTTVTDRIAFPPPGGALYGPYEIALVGTELWTLGPQFVYDITSANSANGTVGTSITPARTIATNANNNPLGGIVYVP